MKTPVLLVCRLAYSLFPFLNKYTCLHSVVYKSCAEDRTDSERVGFIFDIFVG